MAWWVYLISCVDGSLYAGSTTDPARRAREHAAGLGGAYTRSRRPVRLVYCEPQPTRSAAQRREAELKRWPRAKKLALVAGRGVTAFRRMRGRTVRRPGAGFRTKRRTRSSPLA